MAILTAESSAAFIRPPIAVIYGKAGSGKTSAALQLARHTNLTLLSVEPFRPTVLKSEVHELPQEFWSRINVIEVNDHPSECYVGKTLDQLAKTRKVAICKAHRRGPGTACPDCGPATAATIDTLWEVVDLKSPEIANSVLIIDSFTQFMTSFSNWKIHKDTGEKANPLAVSEIEVKDWVKFKQIVGKFFAFLLDLRMPIIVIAHEASLDTGNFEKGKKPDKAIGPYAGHSKLEVIAELERQVPTILHYSLDGGKRIIQSQQHPALPHRLKNDLGIDLAKEKYANLASGLEPFFEPYLRAKGLWHD